MANTAKGLRIFDATTDLGKPLPDAQAQLQGLANDLTSRIALPYTTINTAQETFTQAAYANAPTPDRCQNVVLPSNGLLAVGFFALWKAGAAATCSAAIFLGANQLRAPSLTAPAAVGVQEVSKVAAAATGYGNIETTEYGLEGSLMTAGADESIVTTGLVLNDAGHTLDGGICYIWAAAGTYDVSVQYKSSTGSLSIKERRLWVQAIPYI